MIEEMNYLANECNRESWPPLITNTSLVFLNCIFTKFGITSLGYGIHLLFELLGAEKSI